MIRAPNGSYYDLDFRETAPAAATEGMYKDNVQASILGGLASGVPGELRGLQWIHENFGQLDWRDVVMPSVKIAREGWSVGEDLVRYMGYSSSPNSMDGNFLVKRKEWSEDFAPNGTILGLGDWITRKRYATSLERIAKEGPDVFYKGDMAEKMIEAVKKTNGTMTLEDLKNYRIALRKPAEIKYRGYKMTSNSAPASGVVALAVMNIVSGYEDFGWKGQLNLSTHRLDEAIRFGYGMRTNLGDPSFAANLQSYEEEMLSPKTASQIRSKISDSTSHNISYYDPLGIESLDTPGTSHVTAADHSGLAISLTTTVNLLFGSHVIVPDTGIIMNDEMNDFSIPGVKNAFGYIPSPANYIRPGKRPLSSISPAIVEYPNGTLYFVIGAAGGSRIITATIQNLWFVLDRNMTTLEALSQPRLHDQLIPDRVEVEGGSFAYDNGTVSFLQERGHNVTFVNAAASSAQGIRVLGNGTFEAAGVSRFLIRDVRVFLIIGY